MRAIFLLDLPRRALLAGAFLAGMMSAAGAGGLDAPSIASDPCAPIFTEGMTDEILRGWRAVQAMKADLCGPPPVLLPQFTDREKLEWAFNGSRIPGPAVVPLPGAAWLLVAGLGALVWRGRG